MDETRKKYDALINECKEIFMSKFDEYGPSWLLFRLPSIIDQIFIKIKRIRKLDELGGEGKVPEGMEIEYKGIINYCIIALMMLRNRGDFPSPEKFLHSGEVRDIVVDRALMESIYDKTVQKVRETMLVKNHDYGEAWKDITLQSINDLILVKVYRIFNILSVASENAGKNRVKPAEIWEKLSESQEEVEVDTHLEDILNYCAFALMKMKYKDNVHG